jgi:cytochrome b561
MSIGFANTRTSYGIALISLHWAMAILIVALFILGLYMRGLDYTHPYYHHAPHLHKSFGLLTFALLIIRFVLSIANPKPDLIQMPKWETFTAKSVHRLLYILLFTSMISGYLIPTADGRAIELFNWLSVPALFSNIDTQEDIAGKVHYVSTIVLVGLAALHTLAALKHHFIERDDTLRRIIGTEKTV